MELLADDGRIAGGPCLELLLIEFGLDADPPLPFLGGLLPVLLRLAP